MIRWFLIRRIPVIVQVALRRQIGQIIYYPKHFLLFYDYYVIKFSKSLYELTFSVFILNLYG